mgnify:CR=1 FL=1
MDTRRQADSLAVSNLTVGTDCTTAVISDCQTMTHCRLIKNRPGVRAEGAKNDFSRLAESLLTEETNAHNITTGLIGLPVKDDEKKRNRDNGSKGTCGTVAFQDFDKLADPQNLSGLVISVSAKGNPTSVCPAVEGTGPEDLSAAQDSRSLGKPISTFMVASTVNQLSIGPLKLLSSPTDLGNRKKIHTPLYEMSESLVANHNFDLTSQDEKFSSTFLALNNHIATEHPSLDISKTEKKIQAKPTDYDSDSAISHEKKLIGVQSNHDVEHFGDPAAPTHQFNKALCPRSQMLAGAATGPVEAGRLVEIKESALDMDLPINLGTTSTDDLLEMGAPEVIAGTKDMVLPINLATICTDDIIEMGAPNITSETKNLAESCESMIIDDEVQGKSNPESSYDMREKFALENLDFIGYKMTFENNNLPNLIFEEGKFSAELFAKFKKRRANLTRTLYRLFNNEISQPSRSKLSKFLNISQNGLKDADILHKKYLSTKMSELEATSEAAAVYNKRQQVVRSVHEDTLEESEAKIEEVNPTNISHDETVDLNEARLEVAATAKGKGIFSIKTYNFMKTKLIDEIKNLYQISETKEKIKIEHLQGYKNKEQRNKSIIKLYAKLKSEEDQARRSMLFELIQLLLMAQKLSMRIYHQDFEEDQGMTAQDSKSEKIESSQDHQKVDQEAYQGADKGKLSNEEHKNDEEEVKRKAEEDQETDHRKTPNEKQNNVEKEGEEKVVEKDQEADHCETTNKELNNVEEGGQEADLADGCKTPNEMQIKIEEEVEEKVEEEDQEADCCITPNEEQINIEEEVEEADQTLDKIVDQGISPNEEKVQDNLSHINSHQEKIYNKVEEDGQDRRSKYGFIDAIITNTEVPTGKIKIKYDTSQPHSLLSRKLANSLKTCFKCNNSNVAFVNLCIPSMYGFSYIKWHFDTSKDLKDHCILGQDYLMDRNTSPLTLYRIMNLATQK